MDERKNNQRARKRRAKKVTKYEKGNVSQAQVPVDVSLKV